MLEIPFLNTANKKTPRSQSTNTPNLRIQTKPNPVPLRPKVTIHQSNKNYPALLRLRVAIPRLIVQRHPPPLLGPRLDLHNLTLHAAWPLGIKDEVIEL
jgi:hypothetical protein